VVKIGGDKHLVRIKPYKGGTLAVLDGDGPIDIVGRWTPGQRLLSVTVDGRHRIVQVRRAGRDWELQTHGATHRVQVLSPHVADLSKHMIDKPAPDLSRLLLAPMPGLLTKLDVAVGDKVEPGQPVAVMEAMKMENILRAPKAATVKATPAKAGDSLAVDQVIVEFE
jgi:propionyl-CoA carboxylase alpha chain